MGRTVWRRVGTAVLAVLVLSVAMPLHGAEGFKLPARNENAALHYLLAAALLYEAETAEELQGMELIRSLAYPEQPAAFGLFPQLAAIAREDLSRTRSAAWALHEGTQKAHCHFDINWEDPVGDPVEHWSQIRRLLRRIPLAALYAEYRGDQARGAELTVDLLQMGTHLHEDGHLQQAQFGGVAYSIALTSIEGMLARGVDRAIVEKFSVALGSIPIKSVRLDPHMRNELEMFCAYFRRNKAELSKEMLAKLRRQTRGMSAGEKAFADLGRRAAMKQYEEWIDECYREMLPYVEATRKPWFERAAERKAARDRMKELGKMQEAGTQQESGRYNPITYLVGVSCLAGRQSQATEFESRIGMMRIMCAALLYKEDNGRLPAGLAEFRGLFPKGLPADPFTGENFIYSIAEGLPTVKDGWFEEGNALLSARRLRIAGKSWRRCTWPAC